MNKIVDKNVVIRRGSMIIYKETAQGSYNNFIVYKSNDSGYYDKVMSGKLSECALHLGL